MSSRAVVAAAVAWLGLVLATQPAAALGFEVELRSSTDSVQAADTFADVLARHQAGALLDTTTLDGLVGIQTGLQVGGANRDYSLRMSLRLEAALAGQYTFQVGPDWGRGGAVAVFDEEAGTLLGEQVFTGDLWWNNDWNDPDVLTTVIDLEAGSRYAIHWLGFEGCCAGQSTIRFAYEGGAFQPLDTPSLTPFVSLPEPSPHWLGLSGLPWGLWRSARRGPGGRPARA